MQHIISIALATVLLINHCLLHSMNQDNTPNENIIENFVNDIKGYCYDEQKNQSCIKGFFTHMRNVYKEHYHHMTLACHMVTNDILTDLNKEQSEKQLRRLSLLFEHLKLPSEDRTVIKNLLCLDNSSKLSRASQYILYLESVAQHMIKYFEDSKDMLQKHHLIEMEFNKQLYEVHNNTLRIIQGLLNTLLHNASSSEKHDLIKKHIHGSKTPYQKPCSQLGVNGIGFW